MRATFEDFIHFNPTCKKFEDNDDARAVFNLLSEDGNIIAMVDASEAGKPALSGSVKALEDYFDSLASPQIDLNDSFTKKAIGKMVRTILEPFGFETAYQRDMPKSCAAKYFRSATCYRKTGIASMEIVRTIVEVGKER